MDCGPFLMSSVTQPWSRTGEDPADITLKGLTVRLAPDATATFDTGLLRWSGVWIGGWLKLMGTPFDGTHRPPERSRPAVEGSVVFATSARPGWAKDGDWRDPRTEPYIPLPADRARFRGHHVAGDRVSPRNWNLQQWNYKWSRHYGSDLYSVADPTRVTGPKGSLKGDPIEVKSVEVRDGRKRLVLATTSRRPVMQWMLKAALRTADGAELPVEYYGTLNAVP